MVVEERVVKIRLENQQKEEEKIKECEKMTKFYTIQDKNYNLTYNLTESQVRDIKNKYPNQYKVFEQKPPKEMTSAERKRQDKIDQAYFDRTPIFNTKPKKSKPIKSKRSRGKWCGNMFKSSNKRLRSISKTGTIKQKKLANDILRRRKN